MAIRGKLKFLADSYGAALLIATPDGDVWIGGTNKGGPKSKERAAGSAVANLLSLLRRVRAAERREIATRKDKERRAKAKARAR